MEEKDEKLLNKYFLGDFEVFRDIYYQVLDLMRSDKVKCHQIDSEIEYFSYYLGSNHKSVIVIPGGGYENVCIAPEGFPIAQRLNELGYNAFVCTYRIREKALYPNPVNDILNIFKDIKERYGITNYGIVGFSAGSHLAGLMCLKDVGFRKYNLENPSFAMLSYPVITMGKYTHEGSRRFLIGEDLNSDLIHQLSIEENVDNEFPPTFLWQCDKDDIVPVENSLLMKESLDKHNIKCKLELFDSTVHGFALGDNSIAEGWLNRALDFWKSI